MPELKHAWLGARCLQVAVGVGASPELFRHLAEAAAHLRRTGWADGSVSSYQSLAVYWEASPPDPEACEDHLKQAVTAALSGAFAEASPPVVEHRVAVDYAGPDLAGVAEHTGLSMRAVTRRHQAGVYTVAAVGFLPHFAYLWGMDASLAAPRLATPRARVPMGAVGIAGEQTGVYPQASPGGWRLIGQVQPAVCRAVCPRLRVGDRVRFVGGRA